MYGQHRGGKAHIKDLRIAKGERKADPVETEIMSKYK